MLKKEELQEVKRLYAEVNGAANLVFYGKSLRDRLFGVTGNTLSVAAAPMINKEFPVIESEVFNVILDSSGYTSDILSGVHTIDFLYCEFSDIVNNDGQIKADNTALDDLDNKEIRLDDSALETYKSAPLYMLETVLLASQFGLKISSDTIKIIFENRHLTSQISKEKVNVFLHELFQKSAKVRKGIALLNTLGISQQLFGFRLVETSALNHLNKKDVMEFFTIIFSEVPILDLVHFLMEKIGFTAQNAMIVFNESKAVNAAKNNFPAVEVIKLCGKDRFSNLVRLFKILGYKEYSKQLKDHKDFALTIDDLAVDARTISNAFKIDKNEAMKYLELALQEVMVNPKLNEKDQLLIHLNKLRKINYAQKDQT